MQALPKHLAAWLNLFAFIALAGCAGEAPTGTGKPAPPAQPSRLEIVSGDTQSAVAGTSAGSQLVIRVVDAGGNPVLGVGVAWSATGGGGSVVPNAGSTNAAGLVSASWTLGKTAGANVAVATVQGLQAATFRAIGRPGPATRLEIAEGDAQSASAGQVLPAPFAVKASDQHGNGTPGIAVAWTVVSGGGTLSAASAVTDSAGLARSGFTLGPQAGQATVTATASGLAPATFKATSLPGRVARLELRSGDGQVARAGEPLSSALVVRALDATGNPVSGVGVTWAVIAGGGTLVQATTATDAAGQAQARHTVGTAVGASTVTASAGEHVVRFGAVVIPGPVSTVRVTPGVDTLVVGSSRQFAAEATDRHGNRVTGQVVTWRSAEARAATVSTAGLLTATAPGETRVSAEIGGVQGLAAVAVTAPLPATGIRLTITSPITSDRFAVAVLDNEGATPRVVVFNTAPTKSVVVGLSLSAHQGYQVRVVGGDHRAGVGSSTVGATGKVDGVRVVQGGATQASVTLTPPQYEVAAPSTIGAGATMTISWTVTDPGLSFLTTPQRQPSGLLRYRGASGSGMAIGSGQRVGESGYRYTAQITAPIAPGVVTITMDAVTFANVFTVGALDSVSHDLPSSARGEPARTITVQ